MNHAYSEDRLVELPASGWFATAAAVAPASAIAGVPQVVGACGGARSGALILAFCFLFLPRKSSMFFLVNKSVKEHANY
jgi:hypothetical protein